MKEITISVEEYNYMVHRLRELDQLEINGVDNWEGYGCMCYSAEETCVFCEEE